MNLKKYQKFVKTVMKKFDTKEQEIANWGLGVAGEAGDIAGCIKKTYAHKNNQTKGIRENIGDTMWYLCAIANFYGWNIDEIMNENVDKLKKRYPKGKFRIKDAQRKNKRIDWNEK